MKIEFEVEDQVLVKISPMKGMMQFEKAWNLRPRYVRKFPITTGINKMACRVAFLENLS